MLCFNALKLPPLRVFRPQITASQMTRIRLRYIRHQVGEAGNGGEGIKTEINSTSISFDEMCVVRRTWQLCSNCSNFEQFPRLLKIYIYIPHKTKIICMCVCVCWGYYSSSLGSFSESIVGGNCSINNANPLRPSNQLPGQSTSPLINVLHVNLMHLRSPRCCVALCRLLALWLMFN